MGLVCSFVETVSPLLCLTSILAYMYIAIYSLCSRLPFSLPPRQCESEVGRLKAVLHEVEAAKTSYEQQNRRLTQQLRDTQQVYIYTESLIIHSPFFFLPSFLYTAPHNILSFTPLLLSSFSSSFAPSWHRRWMPFRNSVWSWRRRWQRSKVNWVTETQRSNSWKW